MATVDKIILDGTAYDIADTDGRQQILDVNDDLTDVKTAIDGKPTAAITYSEDNTSLDITTGTITIPQATAVTVEGNAENNAKKARAVNQISAVNLDGTSYSIAGGSRLLVYKSDVLPAHQTGQIAILAVIENVLTEEELDTVQITTSTSTSVPPQLRFNYAFTKISPNDALYSIQIRSYNPGPATVMQPTAAFRVNINIPSGVASIVM